MQPRIISLWRVTIARGSQFVNRFADRAVHNVMIALAFRITSLITLSVHIVTRNRAVNPRYDYLSSYLWLYNCMSADMSLAHADWPASKNKVTFHIKRASAAANTQKESNLDARSGAALTLHQHCCTYGLHLLCGDLQLDLKEKAMHW